MSDAEKKLIAYYSKLCYDRNLVDAAGGNISMRAGDSILVTPGGYSLRNILPECLLTVAFDGRIIDNPLELKASKETEIHLSIYRKRPEVTSIIHVHSAYATAFSALKRTVPMITASSKLKLVETPLVGYADPGSAELTQLVKDCIAGCEQHVKVILLEAHGLISFSTDMEDCFNNAELAEGTAKIAYMSETLKT